jgi:hypothetical protein
MPAPMTAMRCLAAAFGFMKLPASVFVIEVLPCHPWKPARWRLRF